MEEPRASVVEVTHIVPIEDVPYVAARVAERLGMPVDRVRKLIENRTGPITRPLRPDKADAIAQTFEAAGVSVVIRPATEDDDVAVGAPAPATATTGQAPESDGSATPEPTPEADPAAEPDSYDDIEPETDGDDIEPEPDGDDVGPGPDAADDVEPEPDTFDDVGPETDVGDDLEPESDTFDDLEPDDDLAADLGDGGHDGVAAPDDDHGVVMEVDEPAHAAPSAPDADDDAPGRVRIEEDRSAAPTDAIALDPDADDDETNDPGPFGLDARGEVRLRVSHELAFDDASSTPAGPVDRPALGSRDVAASGGPAVLADHPGEEPVIGRSSASGSESSPFGDPDTWGGDDPSGGWIIGTRKARRFEVLHDDEGVSELSDEGEATTDVSGDREGDGAGSDAEASELDGASADGRAPWRGAPGIGRESRRPRFGAPPRLGRVEVDAPGVPEASEVAADTSTDSADGDAAGDAGEAEAAAEAAAEAGAEVAAGGDAAGTAADPSTPGAADGIPERKSIARAPGVVPVPQPGGRSAAGVPTAWRGLGGDDHGPARPVDAQLPRRASEGYDERMERLAAERVTRRRTVMLVTLAIALGLFVLAQVWVAGRASPGFDSGLHRFRDADFAAAQRVWSQLASAGDANAQFMLGYLSEAGLGRPWSARAAASWYRLAADAGHAEAQWRLGLLYEMGLGVPREPTAALRWWGAAADGGHGEAAFTLARARLEGFAGVSDVEGALEAFVRADDLGWPAARPYRDALMVASSGAPHQGALP